MKIFFCVCAEHKLIIAFSAFESIICTFRVDFFLCVPANFFLSPYSYFNVLSFVLFTEQITGEST